MLSDSTGYGALGMTKQPSIPRKYFGLSEDESVTTSALSHSLTHSPCSSQGPPSLGQIGHLLAQYCENNGFKA